MGREGSRRRSAPPLAERVGVRLRPVSARRPGGSPDSGCRGGPVGARPWSGSGPGGNTVATSTIARNRIGALRSLRSSGESAHPDWYGPLGQIKTGDRSSRASRSASIMSSCSGTLHVPVSRYNSERWPVAFLPAPDQSVGSACPALGIGMIGNAAQSISSWPGGCSAAGWELRAGPHRGVAREAGLGGAAGRRRPDRQCRWSAATELMSGGPVNCFPLVRGLPSGSRVSLVVDAISWPAPIGRS